MPWLALQRTSDHYRLVYNPLLRACERFLEVERVHMLTHNSNKRGYTHETVTTAIYALEVCSQLSCEVSW